MRGRDRARHEADGHAQRRRAVARGPRLEIGAAARGGRFGHASAFQMGEDVRVPAGADAVVFRGATGHAVSADDDRGAAARTGQRPGARCSPCARLLADGAIGRDWTYLDLLRDSERLGRALAARHPRGARIAVFANNVREWVLLELAAALAGLTLVTVNPALRSARAPLRARAVALGGDLFRAAVRGNPLGPIVDAACAELPAIRHRILLTDHDALFAGEDRRRAAASPRPTTSPRSSIRRARPAFPRAPCSITTAWCRTARRHGRWRRDRRRAVRAHHAAVPHHRLRHSRARRARRSARPCCWRRCSIPR